jgi:hypothetical protein
MLKRPLGAWYPSSRGNFNGTTHHARASNLTEEGRKSGLEIDRDSLNDSMFKSQKQFCGGLRWHETTPA